MKRFLRITVITITALIGGLYGCSATPDPSLTLFASFVPPDNCVPDGRKIGDVVQACRIDLAEAHGIAVVLQSKIAPHSEGKIGDAIVDGRNLSEMVRILKSELQHLVTPVSTNAHLNIIAFESQNIFGVEDQVEGSLCSRYLIHAEGNKITGAQEPVFTLRLAGLLCVYWLDLNSETGKSQTVFVTNLTISERFAGDPAYTPLAPFWKITSELIGSTTTPWTFEHMPEHRPDAMRIVRVETQRPSKSRCKKLTQPDLWPGPGRSVNEVCTTDKERRPRDKFGQSGGA